MTEQAQSGISRRTLAKGAAWAVPAAAVAAAAPAMAASGRGPTVTVLAACKQPGGSCVQDGFPKFGYTFTVRIDNPTAQPIYIYTSTTITPGPLLFITDSGGVSFSYGGAKVFTPPSSIGGNIGSWQLLAPGSSSYFLFSSTGGTNSANLGVTGTLFVPWGHVQTAGTDPDHSYTPAPTSAAYNPATLAEGWVAAPIYFPAMNPCDNKTCLPTITTTTTTVGTLRQQADTSSTTVETSTTTVETSTTTVETSTTTVEN